MLTELIKKNITSKTVKYIFNKVLDFKRITINEGITLYKEADLSLLGLLANIVREKVNDKKVYFNKNIHIEPTNICIYNCKFCSYSRKEGQEGSWELTSDEIIEKVNTIKNSDITEIHIVGGTHPNWDVYYWGEILKEIKAIVPNIFIKAFTAVELYYMIKKAGINIEEGIKYLKKCGIDSIPGGGAEIFDKGIRSKICNEKITGEEWLNVHEIAHNNNIPSNATMLYGHIEDIEHRFDHLNKLRNLQDKTSGFSAFIPLKYKSKNNSISHIGEVSIIEDLKTYAISRIFLDNINHIKSYWPMLGKENGRISLLYGVDDIDGTIEDTTKIYSMAGAEESHPTMSENEIIDLIKSAGYIPVERDTLYNEIH